ncbi:MAG: YcgN family cysteine cluster protein [Pseudomonadota bacterium]
MRDRFWETVPLGEMTRDEWESLCDGCGRCCLLKLEDEDTGDVHYTSVSCRLFDCDTRQCGNYALRQQLVPGCVVLTPETIEDAAEWMPGSCAYRRLHEGRGLPTWHPLVTGTRKSVETSGVAVRLPLTPEYEVAEEDLEDHVIAEDLIHGDAS